MIDDAGPSPRDARAGGALRRPLRAASRPARAERRAQHRRGALDRRAGGVRRRRRPRAPGMAAGAARRGAGAPRRRRLHRPDRAAPGGRRRGGRSTLRARGAADHLAASWARTTRTRATRGAPTWRSAAPRWSAWARSRSRSSTAATSRSGRTACAPRTPDARVLYVAGAALEHRRAGADAQLRSLARAAYARGRASRRFDSLRGEAPSLRDASCSRSAAASGTCSAAAAPPG